ncbi:MAG: outer membrane protein assembly factor BamA, partial [Acidobacteriota bacterium]
QSKPGDQYNPDLARRDLEAIVSQGWFDPLQTRLLTDQGQRGGVIVIFQVREYPIIRDLQYRGLKSATESDVLTRFKERRTQVSKESQLDPAKANAAKNVLRELLAEKGRPDAKVDIEVEEISATAVALIFDIDEGPRVRVKDIVFEVDRNVFSQRRLRGAMKLVKEAGLISTFSSKDVYFADKLAHDLEGVRFFLGSKGYLQVRIGEPKIEPAGMVSGGIPLPIPGLNKKGPGLRITIPIEVGRRYRIKSVEEKGVTLFQPGLVTAVSGLTKGEWVSAKNIQEGVYKNIKDIYGERGYIQASVDFIPNFIDTSQEEGEVEVTLEVDEGKQFTLKRLEFIGNSNTRDVVMRREVVINEGDPYSKRYWDLSILRLNQLGLFEEIKEKDAITRTNDRTQEVEIDLQVKEKGRQQIQLNGGVSGYSGSFFGLEYSTNNLLGYGESLSLAFSGGNRQLYLMFGFTEPYFLGKPISLGFQIFAQKYQFFGSGNYYGNANQDLLQQASLFGLSSIDAATLFTQFTAGGTVSASSPMAIFTRKFPKFSRLARLGLSYSLTGTKIEDPAINQDPDPTKHIQVTYSQPKIITSRITPSLFFNSLNAAIDPTAGKSLFLGLALSGGILGGDVSTFAPSLEYKMFMRVARKRTEKPHVIGMRVLAGHIRSFGTPIDTQSLSFVGGVPIYERFFLGGEDTIRGYNVRSISPVVPSENYLSTRNLTAQVADANLALTPAPAGQVHSSAIRQYTFDAPEGNCAATPTPANCNVALAQRSFAFIGGDTQLLYNVEYRVPIIGPLSVAAFADVGTSFNLRAYKGQTVTTNFVDQLLTPSGVTVNPAGRIASSEELQNSAVDINGSPIGYRTVFFSGDSRRYDLIKPPGEVTKAFRDFRSSLGLELRVQMPVINVPFRLIFAYNPNAKTDPLDPTAIFLERKTAVRFSIGRTF